MTTTSCIASVRPIAAVFPTEKVKRTRIDVSTCNFQQSFELTVLGDSASVDVTQMVTDAMHFLLDAVPSLLLHVTPHQQVTKVPNSKPNPVMTAEDIPKELEVNSPRPIPTNSPTGTANHNPSRPSDQQPRDENIVNHPVSTGDVFSAPWTIQSLCDLFDKFIVSDTIEATFSFEPNSYYSVLLKTLTASCEYTVSSRLNDDASLIYLTVKKS
jgi:hypothetical protein